MRGHTESHKRERVGWLRAAVLGADDGIVSTASLMLGVAASSASTSTIAIAGLAGLVAGAASMASGEYVSVSSQRDSEAADIEREKREQTTQPGMEFEELKGIYVKRGLTSELAHKVAEHLMAVDPLGSHLRDELGISRHTMARPIQAAFASAGSFAVGAALPLLTLLVVPERWRGVGIAVSGLAFLGLLGAIGGALGGASPWRAMVRVLIGGGIAMGLTTLIGRLVGG